MHYLGLVMDWVSSTAQQPILRWGITLLYFSVLGIICIYGIHRWYLVWLYYRHRSNIPTPATTFTSLPRITVQLPMFNESRVIERIIDAACQLDYPKELLQIQVLDDSTDASAHIAQTHVNHWQKKGYDISYLHRTNRQGFKAGALADAMKHVKADFIAIFDADFVPQKDFLHKTIHYFTNPSVGMVQTRWEHLNRYDSLLTRSQAIFLDGHFVIEHTARNRASRWINFNGTAGLWRKQAIQSAGGWQHDTLTEDVDLSYRAQLAGWNFIYLAQVGCPAELPPEINGFKTQQHRWTKGSIQTAKKLLPTLWKANITTPIKIEAFFHLTSPMVYLLMSIMIVLFYPIIQINIQPFERGTLSGLILGLSLFTLGTVSASAFYLASQREQGRSILTTILQIPMLMSIGVGIALNNAKACLEALVGHESPFVRTPKYNTHQHTPHGPTQGCLDLEDPALHTHSHRQSSPTLFNSRFFMALLEIAMGCYVLLCVKLLAHIDTTYISVPFLCLFAAGYFYVGFSTLWLQTTNHWQTRHKLLHPA